MKHLLPTWDKTGLKFSDFSDGVFHAVVRAKRLGDPRTRIHPLVWGLIKSLRGTKRRVAVQAGYCLGPWV
jgi:hypothetical protein